MIVLKNNLGDFIYLDVVTDYSQSYTNQVSQHPVDGSGVVTDHVIRNNPKIQLRGFITGADFNSSKAQLESTDRNNIGINQLVVKSDIAEPITISYEDNPTNLLPDVAGQFFTDSLPQIENLSEGRDATYSERALFEVLKSFSEKKDELTLYEIEGNSVVNDEDRLIITNLNRSESAQTGDGIQFNMTLEKITFTYLVEEEVPEDVRKDFETKSEEEVNKGGQTGSDVEFNLENESLASFLRSLFGV
ncbi:MAG: hypothetical protein GOVbin1096_64 [Prokaryotic dsDNA virus sp.]|jgi:hypothetical protein|nr:MAG: hypothetical protein GOVbin1096_64 [Prokaryotic dsDNA virus sp.]|tara:strand:- start:83915 stop:84655 length:741 start_codon:yes stop_codon:yes gene_type:complete